MTTIKAKIARRAYYDRRCEGVKEGKWKREWAEVPQPADQSPDMLGTQVASSSILKGVEIVSDLGRNDVLAMVAHELRAPLGSVLNTVELLRHVQQGDRERMAEWIERISRQTEYMSRLIEDLVEVSRTGRYGLRLRMEKVDLRNPVGAAIEACLPLIHARRHKLEVALAEHPIWVEADPTRLQQVVANLLTNGAQYTEPGGVIEVMLHQCGQFAILRVKDSGIGILPEALERIFEPFTQGGTEVRRSREGLGIGLAVVRSVVEQHRGAVQARSAGPLQGSEFIVRLPALPA